MRVRYQVWLTSSSKFQHVLVGGPSQAGMTNDKGRKDGDGDGDRFSVAEVFVRLSLTDPSPNPLHSMFMPRTRLLDYVAESSWVLVILPSTWPTPRHVGQTPVLTRTIVHAPQAACFVFFFPNISNIIELPCQLMFPLIRACIQAFLISVSCHTLFDALNSGSFVRRRKRPAHTAKRPPST